MARFRFLLPSALAALLLAGSAAAWAQETQQQHHQPGAAPVAPPQPGGTAGSKQGPGDGAGGGMPGMGMMGMGGGMMDPSHMQQMHEMMMRMHGGAGGMGTMPGMMQGMGMGPGMMTGMGMMPGMGMAPGMMPGMAMMPGMSMMPGGSEDPHEAALAAVNRRMHREMSQPGSGDADIDFARAMIAHHKGAVDMAKLVRAFGDDPEIRKLAEGVIAAQTEEIRTLEAWLGRNQP